MKPSLLLNLYCAVALLLTGAAAANANTYVVNSTGDGDEVFNRAGVCSDSPILAYGHCTLRAAIELSNSIGGANIITFNIPTSDPGYSNGVWTIRPHTALPDVTTGSSINGPGADKLIVSPYYQGYGSFKVTTTGTVTIASLTIHEGAIQGDFGAGVYNASTGTVNINNCTLSGNLATSTNGSGGGGGAVYNATTGTVNISNSLLTQNFASYEGGAIYNNTGIINISNSTLSENYTNHPTGGELAGVGGAVFSYLGTVAVTNTTLSYNTSGKGGGIYSSGTTTTISTSTLNANFADATGSDAGGGALFVDGGTTNLVNCTLTGNGVLSFYGGGGGAILAASGTLNLTNSTIAYNSVFGRETEGGGGVLAYGGVHVKSTIIASNSAQGSPFYTAGPGPDFQGFVVSAGFNLIGKTDGSTGFTAATDKKGTIASPLDSKFDGKGLRSNGGPTQTIALANGSPAIDKGTSIGLIGTLNTDQRGLPRKVDKAVGNATGGDGTDIGAFEVQ